MRKIEKSIVNFLRVLVSTRSQIEVDNTDVILEKITDWYKSRGLNGKYIFNDKNEKVAFLYEIIRDPSKPKICLNACADTAPVGDVNEWKINPFGGEIIDGKMFGRGVADSKASISIFSHLANYFNDSEHMVNISFLFDVDEHSGQFNGIKAYLNSNNDISAFALGYPGSERLIIGSRGFYRCSIIFYGISQHSGSSKKVEANAINKATEFIDYVSKINLETQVSKDFNIPPRISITEINGGIGFSQIPNICTIKLDFRLNSIVDINKAREIIVDAVNNCDQNYPNSKKSDIVEMESWDYFKTKEDSFFVDCLHKSAEQVLNKKIEKTVCGPSNIGNYIAEKDIDVTVGFGVEYENVHAANECVEVSSIIQIYEIYKSTLIKYFLNKA
ncbi:MAG: M20 family metallopeptidase [Bacteroidales bacterium]